jgi:hypothetical protein
MTVFQCVQLAQAFCPPSSADSGWVDLLKPIVVRAGEAFAAVPEAE